MKAAFFHDVKLTRDAAGVHHSSDVTYRALQDYLRHFAELVVVTRLDAAETRHGPSASGPGVEMACLEVSSPAALLGRAAARHVREVLASVDCAIVRLPSFLGTVACREATRLRKPWMAEVVGCAWGALWNHGSLSGKALAAPLFAATRWCVARSPFALYVTREYLQRRYPCGGRTIACSNVLIDAPARSTLEQRLAAIAARPPGRPFTLGLVGSLDVDYKGHTTALEALARLRGAAPGFRLRCLGGGDATRWRRRAAALGVDVEFCGTVPAGEPVMQWLDGLDVFVIPSLTEGLPRCLVEAMSRALPAVGSRVGGIPELVAGECLHAPGDSRGLARILLTLAGGARELEREARRSWIRSCEYAPDVLRARRDGFLAAFAASVGDGVPGGGRGDDSPAHPPVPP